MKSPPRKRAAAQPVADDKTRGMYPRFNVYRLDGSSAIGAKHQGCEHFVLDLKHDKFAPAALRAYATACVDEFLQLSVDLLVEADAIEARWKRQADCPEHDYEIVSQFNRSPVVRRCTWCAYETRTSMYGSGE